VLLTQNGAPLEWPSPGIAGTPAARKKASPR
jgi:hypothetical protein